MKKLMLCFSLLLFIACAPASNSPVRSDPVGNTTAQVAQPSASQCLAGAPEWITAGGNAGMVSAVGISKVVQGEVGMARDEALDNARMQMALNLKGRVDAMTNTFNQRTGTGDAVTIDRVNKQTSEALARISLAGASQYGTWISPCEDYYVLLVLGVNDTKAVKNSLVNTFNTSMDNTQAQWQIWQSKMSQEEMQKELDKAFPTE